MSIPEYTATSTPVATVSHFVFCEVSADPADWLKEAKWVQSMADKQDPTTPGPRVGAIMAHPPPGFGVGPVSAYSTDLDEMQKLPLVRGVRAYLDANTSVMNDLLLGLKELGRRNMVVDTFVPPITDPRVYDVVSKTPGTQYSIEHFGCGCDVAGLTGNKEKFANWTAAVKKLATLPNIQCFNLGGTMAAFPTQADVKPELIKPMLQVAVDAFGYDRLCFEVCSNCGGAFLYNSLTGVHHNLRQIGFFQTGSRARIGTRGLGLGSRLSLDFCTKSTPQTLKFVSCFAITP